MDNEDKMDLRRQAIEAAMEAESMTEGFRIIEKFNLWRRPGNSCLAPAEIHFQEVWPYMTEARWKDLRDLASREAGFRNKLALIERCKGQPVLDAALELVIYNNVFCRSPLDEFYVDPSVLFPGVPPERIQGALALARPMNDDACHVAMAALNYPQAKRTYEEELGRFRRDNPGFSENSYQLAEHRGMISMR